MRTQTLATLALLGMAISSTALAQSTYLEGQGYINLTAGSTWAPSTQTTATNRLFWYPSKGSFVFGSNPQWCASTVGSYSFAGGYSSKASGYYSFAYGLYCNATGYNGIAIGYGSQSTAYYTTAIGFCSKADANCATALAGGTASGYYSVAVGRGVTTSGENSIAIGSTQTDMPMSALGFSSVSIGAESSVFGDYSAALGYQLEVDAPYSIAIGRNNCNKMKDENGNLINIPITHHNPLPGEPVFEVGNGTSESYEDEDGVVHVIPTPSNAFTVFRDGDAWVAKNLIVKGSIQSSNASGITLNATSVTTTGNIGIGTTSTPTQKLEVANGIIKISSASTTSSNNSPGIIGQEGYFQFSGYYMNKYGLGFYGSGADMNTYISSSKNMDLFVNGINRMRISQSGSVGIGTDTTEVIPARLTVRGGGSATGEAFKITDISKNSKLIVLDNGNVGIGTTDAPSEKLEVNGNTKISGGLTVNGSVSFVSGLRVAASGDLSMGEFIAGTPPVEE